METKIKSDNKYTFEVKDGELVLSMLVCEGKEEFSSIKLCKSVPVQDYSQLMKNIPLEEIRIWNIDRLISMLNAVKEHTQSFKK